MDTLDVQDMREALTAASDALNIDLKIDLSDRPYNIAGQHSRPLNWFGSKLSITPKVTESLVDFKRSIAVIVFHLVGNLYSCVISDREQQHITMFLLDGKKLGLTPNKRSEILPILWSREGLYRALLIGVKATYERKFYGDSWKVKGKGIQWINDYLAKKVQDRVKTKA